MVTLKSGNMTIIPKCTTKYRIIQTNKQKSNIVGTIPLPVSVSHEEQQKHNYYTSLSHLVIDIRIVAPGWAKRQTAWWWIICSQKTTSEAVYWSVVLSIHQPWLSIHQPWLSTDQLWLSTDQHSCWLQPAPHSMHMVKDTNILQQQIFLLQIPASFTRYKPF